MSIWHFLLLPAAACAFAFCVLAALLVVAARSDARLSKMEDDPEDRE